MRLVGFFIGVLCGVFQSMGWFAVMPDFMGFNLPTLFGVVLLIISAVIMTLPCCYVAWHKGD